MKILKAFIVGSIKIILLCLYLILYAILFVPVGFILLALHVGGAGSEASWLKEKLNKPWDYLPDIWG